jgi:RimJ/RimL family protein N-acetyltransferase
LCCSDANPRSAHVAERCGFVREGQLRQSQKLADGRICGEYYYGLLREEYLPGRETSIRLPD